MTAPHPPDGGPHPPDGGPHPPDDGPVHVVVMGVAGSGKTTVAGILAARLGRPCAEADDLHPAANVAKMRAGVPLTDEDRRPWLEALRAWLTAEARAGRGAVVTCSALRRAYRDVLRGAEGRVRFVHLVADPATIAARMAARSGHFMPPSLLPSQLATLEPLDADEDGVVVAADVPPDEVADRALRALGLG